MTLNDLNMLIPTDFKAFLKNKEMYINFLNNNKSWYQQGDYAFCKTWIPKRFAKGCWYFLRCYYMDTQENKLKWEIKL